ncbi:hypothetical protein C8R42DRAFT_653994 [Lentinula raphanica]|nr:hypothetical protein C8R42DRAFT_653994 [Lentinula raphanica]
MYLYKIVATCTLLASCLRVVASPLVGRGTPEVEDSQGSPELKESTDQVLAPESAGLSRVGWLIEPRKNEDQSARFSVVAEVMGKQYYFWMSNGNIRHEVRTNTRVTWLSRKAKFEIPFSDSKESAILQAYSEYPTASSWKRDSYIVGVLESWYRRSGVSEREIESDMLTLEDEFRGKRRQVEKKNLRDTQPRQKKRVRLSQD